MDYDPLKKEPYLRSKLDEYNVDVPDFPVKTTHWNRFIHLLASPANDPLDSIVSVKGGVMALKIVPAVGTAGLVTLHALFFL